MPDVTPTVLKGLNIRDKFAVEALGFLIQKYESTSVPVPEIVSRAYQYATSMIDASEDYEGTTEADEYNVGQVLVDGFAALVTAIGQGGGGGGTTNVNLDDLIKGLGYDKSITPTAGTTQANLMASLIAAVTNIGKIKKADVSNVGDTQAAIDSVSDILVFSDFNAIVPYKVTPLQLANRLARYEGLVERTVSTFPSSTIITGSYYKLSASTSSVDIYLPALSSDGIAKIIIFKFTCTAASGESTASLSITTSNSAAKKGRGSSIPTTLSPGTYEVDCVDNGSEWIVGITEIVS